MADSEEPVRDPLEHLRQRLRNSASQILALIAELDAVDDPYEVALWGTQAGGLARWDADKQAYVWHELPDWAATMADGDPDKPVIGQPIHPEMDLIPANASARRDLP